MLQNNTVELVKFHISGNRLPNIPTTVKSLLQKHVGGEAKEGLESHHLPDSEYMLRSMRSAQ